MVHLVTLWFFTDRVQELYDVLKERQLRAAAHASKGAAGEFEVRLTLINSWVAVLRRFPGARILW